LKIKLEVYTDKMLSYLPDIISIIVGYADPNTTYPINRIWSDVTYRNISKRTKQATFNKAIETCDIPVIKRLIKDVDINNESLHTAILHKHSTIVKILLDDPRVDPERYVGEDYNALMLACSEGDIQSVKLILPIVNPNIQDSQGYTSLMIACYEGHEDIIHILLKDLRVNPHLKDCEGMTAVMHSIFGGNVNALKAMLDDKRVRGRFNRRKALKFPNHDDMIDTIVNY